MELSFSSFIGFVGMIVLTCSAIPQLYTTYKTKSVLGLSFYMVIMWVIGMISMFTYVWLTSKDMILLLNYGFNLVVESIILYFYIRFK